MSHLSRFELLRNASLVTRLRNRGPERLPRSPLSHPFETSAAPTALAFGAAVVPSTLSLPTRYPWLPLPPRHDSVIGS
jgi:hypothetical protein